jgi:hypothetical protein
MEISGDDLFRNIRRKTHRVLQAGRRVGIIPRGGASAPDAGIEGPNKAYGFLEKYGLWIAGGLAAILFLRRRA